MLKFAAIATEREVHEVATPYGRHTHVREEGQALHPAREPLEVLEGIRRAMGEAYFSAQYQQEPAPPGGGVIKGEWFGRYDALPSKFNRIIQSWDTASKVKQLNDYTACVTLGLSGGKFYILNVVRARLEAPALLAAVKAQAALYPNPTIVIEDHGSGTGLIQNLKRDNITVSPFNPVGEKLMRMEAHAAFIENGNVLLPREAHWLGAFLHELMMFPKGRHDDQVDALSQGLEFARNSKWSQFFDWINEDLASDRRAASRPQRTSSSIASRKTSAFASTGTASFPDSRTATCTSPRSSGRVFATSGLIGAWTAGGRRIGKPPGDRWRNGAIVAPEPPRPPVHGPHSGRPECRLTAKSGH